MTYKGIARGKVIELQGDLALPEGTEVEIVVKDWAKNSVTVKRYTKGSPEAILKFLDTPPLCTPADVDALLQAIKEGRQPTNYQGIFDQD
jgi:predicted DNA-binding antitoxin AbrB/MazE fold protein